MRPMRQRRAPLHAPIYPGCLVPTGRTRASSSPSAAACICVCGTSGASQGRKAAPAGTRERAGSALPASGHRSALPEGPVRGHHARAGRQGGCAAGPGARTGRRRVFAGAGTCMRACRMRHTTATAGTERQARWRRGRWARHAWGAGRARAPGRGGGRRHHMRCRLLLRPRRSLPAPVGGRARGKRPYAEQVLQPYR